MYKGDIKRIKNRYSYYNHEDCSEHVTINDMKICLQCLKGGIDYICYVRNSKTQEKYLLKI